MWERSAVRAVQLAYITGIFATDGARKVDVKKRFADGLGRHAPRSRRDGTDPAVDVEQILNLEAEERLQQSTSITTATGSSKEKLSWRFILTQGMIGLKMLSGMA